MSKPRCCISVISGAPRPVLERCLAHLDRAQHAIKDLAALEVLFVDNSGIAGERWVKETYPHFEYLARERPCGFASNSNLALQRDADYVLLLNSDAFLREDTIPALLETLGAHPRWAAVSAHLQNEDGSDQGTGFSFPGVRSTLLALSGLRWNCFLHGCQCAIGTEDIEVDWVPAACLLMRRAAIQEVGLLDEGFDPGYGEDIDWCKRAARAGWRIGVCARARVVHLGGASFSALGALQFALFVRHLCRYYYKHYPIWAARALALLVAAGLAARGLLPRNK
ncbi:MAG: glycosyltransferase [Anaerolineae bacterium]|nr:glycosyltransferase [Anaerolineae bacterium]